MPIGKVDSKSFQTAQQANPFLRLSVPGAAAAATAGGGGGGPHSPTSGRDSTDGAESAAAELWRELGGSQDTVSRCVYMCVCVCCVCPQVWLSPVCSVVSMFIVTTASSQVSTS